MQRRIFQVRKALRELEGLAIDKAQLRIVRDIADRLNELEMLTLAQNAE